MRKIHHSNKIQNVAMIGTMRQDAMIGTMRQVLIYILWRGMRRLNTSLVSLPNLTVDHPSITDNRMTTSAPQCNVDPNRLVTCNIYQTNDRVHCFLKWWQWLLEVVWMLLFCQVMHRLLYFPICLHRMCWHSLVQIGQGEICWRITYMLEGR